jgi:histidinol-phosphatase
MCRSVKRMASPAVDLQVLELAVDLACRAGQVAAGRFFAADFTARRKADGTEVTDADLAVEELIRAELLGRCAGDAIYGEEGGAVAGSSGRRWIIDAIDGTTYFAHRIPLFTTMLAYEDEHGPAAGVISYPVAQQMISAGRGRGCWIRTGATAAQPPILRHSPGLRGARVQLVNPGTWHPELLAALHQNVTITGYLGVLAGVLAGLLDAVVVAGL